VERGYNLKIEAGFSCLPNGRTDYVELYADIPVRSGIPSPGQTPRTPAPQYQPALPVRPPTDQKRPDGPQPQQEQGTEEMLPAYEEVLPSIQPRGRVNRQYGQSSDYYTDLEASEK
jgi:hypothetical protein